MRITAQLHCSWAVYLYTVHFISEVRLLCRKVISKHVQKIGEKLKKPIFYAPILVKGVICRVKNKKFGTVITTFVLLLAVLLPYVHAQLFKDAYVIRTTHVFPAAVVATGWNNVETITFQNLDEYALLQEFNGINAVTLNTSEAVQFERERTYTKPQISGGQEVPAFSTEVLIPAATATPAVLDDSVDFGLPENTTAEDLILVPETQTTTTDRIESLQSGEELIDAEGAGDPIDTATTTVLRHAESLFALAVAAVTAVFDTTVTTDEVLNNEISSGSNELLIESVGEPVVQTVEEVVTIPVAPTEDAAVMEVNDTPEISGEVAEPALQSEFDFITSPTPTSSISDATLIVDEVDEQVHTIASDCTDQCGSYFITLSDFGYPLDTGVEVSGAQLRLSFAAKVKPTRDLIPEFSILYSIDQGATWLSAGAIIIDDEASNSINGGYYLFALPEVADQMSLDALQVQLRYDNDPSALQSLYVESAWLELFTLEAPEILPTDLQALLSDDGFTSGVLSGDELRLPNGEKINFSVTDDNTNETLIIKTNEDTYQGLSEVATYFSVTNTASKAEEFSIQTYFPREVGEVVSLEMFNQNKPRTAVIPEYRPYVYHCEAGWEYVGEQLPESLDALSRQLAEDAVLAEASSRSVLPISSESTSTLEVTSEEIATTTALVFEEEAGIERVIESKEIIAVEDQIPAYSCRNTNVVRECDELDGANTACVMLDVKVAEHNMTRYEPGWEKIATAAGEQPRPGVLRKIAQFVGLGPDKKDVPAEFEVRAHTPGTYLIEPGETKYFKMDIAFPPFSNGEYWIEVIGNSEYGLLDPFWTSDWSYRMPITIDNTNGTTDLSEYQVFLEISSALTDFWNNVAADGSDIRFAQQVSTGNFSNAGTAQTNWFDPSFGGRVAITIPPLTVTEDQSNFPVYVDLSLFDAGFWAGVKSDGGDIRVTTSDGTELPIDLVEINTTAQTGELHFLASAIAAHAANTFYVYYDNTAASGYASSDPSGSQAVWTGAGYQAVYHFSDNPSTVGNVLTDETGYGHDLTVITAAPATTTGQMGTAYDFTAVSGYLASTTWTFPGGDPLVITGLYRMPVVSNSALWQWGTANQPDDMEFRPWYTGLNTAATGLHYFGATGGATYTLARATSTWSAFGTVGTTSISGNNLVFEDGVLIESVPQTVGNPTNTGAGGFSVARTGTNTWWNGQVDELRVALTTRTDERVRLETSNLSDPTHFYSIGDSQVPDNAANLTWYSTSWGKRLKFSIPQAKISANLTDFPVYIDLSMFGTEFFSAVKTDGRDIRITTGDGVTELPFELVSIDKGTNSGELYFKTNLNRNAANDFYIYYQNEDALPYSRTSTYGSNNVWTNNYLAVYHLEEDAVGTSNLNLYKDSTSNQYDGDDYNTSNSKVGLFGKGQEFGDDQNDYLILPREVLNGVSNLTTSWWHQTTIGGAQTIVSGAKDNTAAGSNEYIIYFSNTSNLQLFYQNAFESFGLSDTIGTHNTGSWNFFAVTGEDAIDEVNFYVNGVGDTENPDPQPIAPLSIANGGLIVGQEQDSLGGGFQNNQNFEGQLDELRFASVVRNKNWLAVEYANMNNVSSFVATSSAEDLAITDFVELDFWVQHFDNTSDQADIWVQVDSIPAGEETTIYMYYGSTGATSASDELATFSYSTSTDLYYVVDDSGATSISVQSLIDGNAVSIDGGTPVPLNQGERTTFATFTGSSIISTLGPISGTVTGNSTDSSDTLAPISFATTTFAVPLNRAADRWYIHAPFATTTVSTYIGNSGTASQTIVIPKNTASTSTTDPTDSGSGVDGNGIVVEATSPVLLMHRTTNPGDGIVAYPPTTRDLFGVDSNYFHLSATADNPDATVYCSVGTGGATTGTTRGEKDDITQCTTAAEGAGSAVRFTGAIQPISAVQMADGDGNEATVFWPQHEFGTRYFMTNDAAYAAVVCSPRFGDVALEVQDSAGNLVESATCSPVGNNPGKAYFNHGNGTNGDAINFTAGHQIVSTNGKPFYVIYEDVNVEQDEKNILGSVQARKFDGVTNRLIGFGAQESATIITYDDDLEQLSYRWYENTTLQTPTSSWPINASEDVEEGVAISGSGAVDDGDILRLRMNLAVTTATATVQSSAFTLQYAAAAGVGQCSSATSWHDLGEIGSTTALFRGYNNPTLEDGTTLSSTTLASSTVLASYEERNYSNLIPNEIGIGEVGEWDWVIEAVSVDINTTYCFRMVRATGHELTTYTTYPELITVGPPNTPSNLVYFDNEHTTDLTPVLEFVSIDLASDDIQYQVQVDDDPTFASVEIDRNSTAYPLNFENVTLPSDKAPFTSGNLIRFTAPTSVASSTTYWWRVRASDPLGSATASEWSLPTSFTTNQNLQTSEWFQTTGEQFTTNTLTNLTTTAGAVSASGVLGMMVSTPVDFDTAVVGNAWGEVDWSDTETVGEIRIQVEYKNGGSWQLIPNTLLPGNSTGVSIAPISLRELDTAVYNELRLVATFDGSTLSLQDWTIRWGLRVETPILGDLFDNQKTVETLPVFDFVSTDPQSDELEYEISFSTDKTFLTGSSTYNSSSSAGFANSGNGGDASPFTSGATVTYTTQVGSPFINTETYWWRVRAKDPNGDDSWSPWSNPDSFTVDTGLTVSTWFQTTKEQFEEGTLNGTIATTADAVVVNDKVGEFGKTTVTNGTWTTIDLQSIYNNPVVVASVRYTPLGDISRSARVRNKTATSFELLVTNSAGLATGSTVVDYLVVERGDWVLEDGSTGKRIVANTFSNVSDVVANPYPASGYGEDVTFSPAFAAAPAVVATISSDNDSTWAVVGLNDGNIRNNEPTASGMGIYLARGMQTAIHDPEDVDYIVMAPGHGTNNGSEFDADVSAIVHDEAPVTAEAFFSPFSSAPEVVLVQQGSERGGQGGFAGLYAATIPTTNNYYPFIDEDVPADRAHTIERILAFAFENTSGVLKRYAASGLSGTVAGENIIFTDGAGPKYDNFSWNDSTPGVSDVYYQMEYEVSPGIYALIPNSIIPGNSIGTSVGPIDLTSVDINIYPVIRPVATLTCSGGNCPQINDWQLEWSEGVNMSGTLKEYDRLTAVATGTIRAAVNGTPVGGSATVAAGSWTLSNITAFSGDTVTVWVDGATESEEAVGVFVYDGTGDITGVELFEQHLSISADEEETVTNASLGLYDNLTSGDEDIFYNVDTFNNLVVCSVGACSDASIYIGPGNTYIPAAAGGTSVTTHDVINDGTIELDSNTVIVTGSWKNNATSSIDTATINFTAATGTESISSTESPLVFHTLSFGSGAGDAVFTLSAGLDLSGSLTVASGTLDRSGLAISLAGNLTTGTGGFWLGLGTTSFDGAGAKTWRDDNLITQKVGDVLIDGASTNVTALTNVGAYDIRIGTNDRLNGTSGKTIYVAGDWENNGIFSAQSGTVELIHDDRTYPPTVPGSQDWYADSNFTSRLMIETNPVEIPGVLTNFPVYIDLSTLGNDFWNSVHSDGRDIRITSGDGQTELPYDLVAIDAVTKTGELHFLTNSVDSATSTYFFIYFNNATATAYYPTDTYGSQAVWSQYEAVYHFVDDPTAVDSYVYDATTNGNHLLVEVAGLATSTGQLGQSINLIGSTGILRNAGFTWTAGNPLVTSGWYKMPAASNESLWQWGTAASPNSIEFRPWYQTTNGLHYFGVTANATYAQSPRDTTNWLHFTTIGATTTGQDNLVYQNSIEVERVTQTVANPYNNGATGLQVGREGTGGSLQAQIDELRISTVLRTSDWVEAEYSNQKTPTVFYATSSVQSYTPDVVIDEASHRIDAGGSPFYNLIFNDATTSPAFTEPSVTITNDLTIATGTVAFPTGVLTIGGSLTNNGYFMHNNGQVTFNSTAAETIELHGTEFYNGLYNVVFNGSGSWTFADSNATTSNNITINNGTVVFPTGVLAVGGFLDVNAGGFNANAGTIHFTSVESESISTKGSSFNTVIFGNDDPAFGWYNSAWGERMVIKVASTSVAGMVTDFPVYLDLSTMGNSFWAKVAVDGRDIRMTSSDGKTELPIDLVDISVGLKTGELHFLAPSLSPVVDTTFYVYFDNAAAEAPATDSVYGANAVWTEYEAVYHFNGDPTTGVPDMSGNGRNLSPLVGTPVSTVGLVGDALDLTGGNVMVGNSGWTWTAGEDLVSSGLYYQSAVDNGALWEFGTVCGANNGTCLAFLPWYTRTTGYHRFGVTTADTYTFSRNGTIWHHFTTNGRATAGQANQIFEDSILRGSVLQTVPAQNPTNTGLQLGRYTAGTYMNIKIDELRFASTTRSQQWITTEYRNLTAVKSFYSTSTQSYLEVVPSYTLDEATTVATGDVKIYYANLVAPSSNFSIGGSAFNSNGSYNPNNATTTFNSTDVGETVAFGDGAFYNLSFNGVGGGWTIATTTVLNDATLITGADFTLAPGTMLTVAGIFRNSFNEAATTWDDSILVLSGGDYTVTNRLDFGDDYATLVVSNDSDLVMWNSSVSTSTIRDTSSLYMPDFNGVNGTLRIYGAYERTSGTEYWSRDTDFDGTSLVGGGERTVSVEIGRGASIYLATSTTLVAKGAAGATTTVAAISGIYSLTVNAGTLNTEYASFTDMGPKGLSLTNGTTVNTLTAVEFGVAGGRSGITVDAATVNTQPSSEFTNIVFATTTANGIYEPAWSDQIVLTIDADAVNEDLVNYPVYVNLSHLGTAFWNGVQSDGRDIRVTTDGGVELPIDLVEINTTTKTGELYFLASAISNTANTVFYIHFNNPAAAAYGATNQYGRQAVWANYEAVYHFNENPTISITDMTGNGHNLFPTSGTPATTTGLVGTALDTTAANNVKLENLTWTWTPGDDLVSSGLYRMANFDTSALWQFGDGSGSDNGTYLSFMPWYNNTTRGYFRFGMTSGTDYSFTRNAASWHHFTTIGRATAGEVSEIYEDNILRDSVTQLLSAQNPTNTGLRIGAYQTTTYGDMDIDELRFSVTPPSANRIDAEYRNFTDATSFYATSSAETFSYNVTTDGVPATFWLFSGGTGNLYGEEHDNDDGNPGSIQWDDSNFSVTISGTVYNDDGVTPATYPVCNGSTEVVTVVLDGMTTYTASCNPLDGSFSVSGISYTGEPQIVTYLNSEAATPQTNVQIYDEITGTGTVAGVVMTVNRPSVVDGSVLVLIAGKDDDPLITAPVGWTAINTLGNTTGDQIDTGIWYRVVTDAGTEPTTYNFTADNGEGFSFWMGALINVDTVTPIDVASTWTKVQNQFEPTAPSITTVTNGALVLSAWYTYLDTQVVAPVYNWFDRANNIVNPESGNLTVSSRSMLTAGATGDVSLSGVIATRESHVGQFAFRPSTGPTGSSSMVAAAVTKTPIGNSGSPYNTIALRDQKNAYGTVAAAAAIDINRPAVENGDVLVAILGKEDDFIVTPPGGWTQGDDLIQSVGNAMYTGVWYHVVTNAGSEPVSYSFISNDDGVEEFSYWIGSFSGVDATNVFDVTPVWSNLQNVSSPTAPSINTVTPGAYVLASWYVIDDNAMDMPASPWLTLAQDVMINNRLLAVSGRTMVSAGATSDATMTNGSVDDVNVGQFALRPAAVSVADTISDMDLYQNRVIVRHENVDALTIADMVVFDHDNDSDLPFTAATGVPDLLSVQSGSGLVIWNDKTFTTGGAVALLGAGSTPADGSLLLKQSSILQAHSSDDITIGGSLYLETGATFSGSASTVDFTATNPGQSIGAAASSTITLYDVSFTGVGGNWAIQTPLISETGILVATGTVSGVANVTINDGSFSGNGTVDFTGGTTLLKKTNTLGGMRPWTFNNLTLGSGAVAGITTPASTATTSVRGTLTIAAAHFLAAGNSLWDLQGNGNVFVETGTFIEDMSTIRFSGTTPNIKQTPYYNVVIDTDRGGTVTATAPTTGLQILNNLTIGVLGTSTLNANTNDPTFSVGNNVLIGSLGTLEASNNKTLTVNGNWENDGIFNANGGTVTFSKVGGSATITAGDSPFAVLNVLGSAAYTVTENATSTGNLTITTGSFTLNPGLTLAVGGAFSNTMTDDSTTWTDTTLSFYSGTAFVMNTKTTSDTYDTIVTASGTHPRLWNSTTTVVTTNGVSSLYSMNHRDVTGELYIFGDYVNEGYSDYWSYATDFDGASLGVPRQASVYIEAGGTAQYPSGSLYIIGTSSASTTIAAQTSGTYELTIGGDTEVEMSNYVVRDTTSAGLIFTGAPHILNLSHGDLEVAIADGSTMTVGGSVITANPALNFTDIRMATTTAINAYNVTATGTSASAWRFVNVQGNLGGEAKDVDPAGDPGYLTWEDSAAIINISGAVYSDEGVTASAACDGTTKNVWLSIQGLTFASTTCAVGTGAYSFVGVGYGVGNTLTVYIKGESEKAVTVTQDPVSSISGLDLYENRVILTHESSAPMTIADMSTWDSDNDADILFNTETAGTNTLVLPANTKLIVWNNKKFTPGGNVTVSGGGAGTDYDGTLELRAGATFTAANGQVHSIGGSLLTGTGAVFTPAQSTVTFTTTGTARTIDSNNAGFYNLSFTGAGSWTVADPALLVVGDYIQSAGSVTLPSATTTIGGTFDITGGSFVANSGLLYFTATDVGNVVRFNGSDTATVRFNGTGGSWIIADTNATTTNSFTVSAGTVTLPTGTLTVGDNFIVQGSVVHAGGSVNLIGTGGGNLFTLKGNTLNNLKIIAGTGDYTMTDAGAAFLGDLFLQSGQLTVGTGTVSVGGSFDVSGGTFISSNGTLLFNSANTGEFIDTGTNDLYDVVFGSVNGGWTIVDNATTTNNFSLAAASSFTMSSGTRLYIGGVFTNNVGGTATNWNGTQVVLGSGTEYEVSGKAVATERYNILEVGTNTDISMWNSSATTTIVASSGSLYSQDHNAVNGSLYIFGDYHIATTTEHWSYATDFDGAALGGSPRAASVAIAGGSTVTVDGGTLHMLGSANSTSTVSNQGTGIYTFTASAGIFDAEYYRFRNLDADGLQILGTATIGSLSLGDFEQASDSATLITLVSTALNTNASLVVTNTRFATGGFVAGTNISLDATTTNSWLITGASGNLWGESYDVDGTDDCSSIRWDDSQCLLTEQATYRWRNDDGGEGAAPGTWFDSNWAARKRVRVVNEDATTYTDVAVKVEVAYDTDMQTDFDDVRFTDASGTTTLSYWREQYTTATAAQFWVKVPTMNADTVTELYLYYGNNTATTTSEISDVFNAYDDFDDNNLTEYSGDTAKFGTTGTFAYGGGYGLYASPNPNDKTTDGIGRTDFTISQGEIIRYMQYVDTTVGSADEVCTLFAVQSPVTANQNYGVCLEQFGTDRVSLVENVQNTDSTGTVLASSSISLVTGWYEIEIDWQTNNSIDVAVFDATGSLAATTSATDSTYTSGGFGFTFWGQNGGWDSYISWPRTATQPVVYLGAEQLQGGASWAAAQNTPTGGFLFDETARLRIGIENTGLPITNQNFRLEFAPKLAAPSCEAVTSGSFTAVPNLASCGTSAICMTTSANVTTGSPTTDHLLTAAGAFVPGQIVADTSNQSTAINVDQNKYIELEYVIKLTTNAVNDAYCFRVTDGGSTLDSYAKLPELTLAFDPTVGPISFNNGLNISLTPGTTTTILATSTVTDYNGTADLAYATTTFYRSTVTASCTPDNNNCYVASGAACTFSNCVGTSCTLTCRADFEFHADPTDQNGGEFWYAFMEVADQGGATDFDTSFGIDVFTIRALDVLNAINYGTVDINENTGTFNPTVSIVNLGNEAIDVEVAGTDMTDGVASVIPATQQRFSTSTFDYNSCVSCNTLSVTGSPVEVDLLKPLVSDPLITDDIYWGIAVPFGIASNPHSGMNVFTAIAD